jgi:hypothetical protein
MPASTSVDDWDWMENYKYKPEDDEVLVCARRYLITILFIVINSSTASRQGGPHAAKALMMISRATRSGASGLQLPHNF